MIRAQQKTSGTFRSWEGAEAFGAVRSCISTIRMRGMNVMESIASVFEGEKVRQGIEKAIRGSNPGLSSSAKGTPFP